MDSSAFEDISEEGKDLISKLLIRDPAARLDADQILAHKWFEKCS